MLTDLVFRYRVFTFVDMKLKELKRKIDELMLLEGASDLEVSIVLSEPSIGALATTGVLTINTGIDWNSGQLLIFPREHIIRRDKE